jgi:hypothetical protein
MGHKYKDCEKHGPYRLWDDNENLLCPDCRDGSPAHDPKYLEEKRFTAKANELFGNNWHRVVERAHKEGAKICYWCKEPETTKAWVNIWGTIIIAPACDTCFVKNNGIARDEL